MPEPLETLPSKVHQPIRIYLFGSVARGDDGPDSDLDFLVVVPDDAPEDKLRPGAGAESSTWNRVRQGYCAVAQHRFPRSGRLGSGHPCRPPSCAREGCSMTPIEARARESREWLAKADEDLASVRVLIGAGHIANALFFCQQAAETSLKAFLTWHQRAVRRTHDLGGVGRGLPRD